jgi:SAM-dependent methyltransferase
LRSALNISNSGRIKKRSQIDYSKRGVEDRKKKLLDIYLTSGYCSILDLGCGAGYYSPLLAQKGEFVIGLDFSLQLCKLSKKLGFNVVRGDGMFLPFKNGAFDVVWASEIIEHLPSLTFFDELERVAKMWIIATIPNPSSSNYRADPTHILKFTISSLRTYVSYRKDWNYFVKGIGIEWPAAPWGLKIPKFIRILTFYFTFHMPWLSPTLGVIGLKSSSSQGRSEKVKRQ